VAVKREKLPGSGDVVYWLGIAAALAFALSGVADLSRTGAQLALWAGWAALLCFLFGIWPAVFLAEDQLELRGVFSTTSIRLAAINSVAIQQMLTVFVGEQVHRSAAIGRGWRQVARANSPAQRGTTTVDPANPAHIADFVEHRLNALVEQSRSEIRPATDQSGATERDVQQRWSWPIVTVFSTLSLVCLSTFGW
jgi:hypothetical protein